MTLGLFILPKANSEVNIKDLPKATPETIYKYKISPLRIYQYAKQNQVRTIWYLRDYLDMEDNQDMTALCYAQVAKDTKAYNLLKKAGASTKVLCHDKYYQTSAKLVPQESFINMKAALIGGAIVGVAALSGGGGGGSSAPAPTCEEGTSTEYTNISACVEKFGGNEAGWDKPSGTDQFIAGKECYQCNPKNCRDYPKEVINGQYTTYINNEETCGLIENLKSPDAPSISEKYTGTDFCQKCSYTCDNQDKFFTNNDSNCTKNGGYKCSDNKNQYGCYERGDANQCPEGYTTTYQSEGECNTTGGYDFIVHDSIKAGDLLCTKCVAKDAPEGGVNIAIVNINATDADIKSECDKIRAETDSLNLLTLDTYIDLETTSGEFKYCQCKYKCNGTTGYVDSTDYEYHNGKGWNWESYTSNDNVVCYYKTTPKTCTNENYDINSIKLNDQISISSCPTVDSLSYTESASDSDFHGDESCNVCTYSCADNYDENETTCQTNEGKVAHTCTDTYSTGCYQVTGCYSGWEQVNNANSCFDGFTCEGYSEKNNIKCREITGCDITQNMIPSDTQCPDGITCEATDPKGGVSCQEVTDCADNYYKSNTLEDGLKCSSYRSQINGIIDCCIPECDGETYFEDNEDIDQKCENTDGWTLTPKYYNNYNKTCYYCLANGSKPIEYDIEISYGATKDDILAACDNLASKSIYKVATDYYLIANVGNLSYYTCIYECDSYLNAYEEYEDCNPNGGYNGCTEDNKNQYGCYVRGDAASCPDGTSTEYTNITACVTNFGGNEAGWSNPVQTGYYSDTNACYQCNPKSCIDQNTQYINPSDTCENVENTTVVESTIFDVYYGNENCKACKYTCNESNTFSEQNICEQTTGYECTQNQTSKCWSSTLTEIQCEEGYATNCTENGSGWENGEASDHKSAGNTCYKCEAKLCSSYSASQSNGTYTYYTNETTCSDINYLTKLSNNPSTNMTGDDYCTACMYECDQKYTHKTEAQCIGGNNKYNCRDQQYYGCYYRSDANQCLQGYSTDQTVENCGNTGSLGWELIQDENRPTTTNGVSCLKCNPLTCSTGYEPNITSCPDGYTLQTDENRYNGDNTCGKCIENQPEDGLVCIGGENQDEALNACNTDQAEHKIATSVTYSGKYGESYCYTCNYECNEGKGWTSTSCRDALGEDYGYCSGFYIDTKKLSSDSPCYIAIECNNTSKGFDKCPTGGDCTELTYTDKTCQILIGCDNNQGYYKDKCPDGFKCTNTDIDVHGYMCQKVDSCNTDDNYYDTKIIGIKYDNEENPATAYISTTNTSCYHQSGNCTSDYFPAEDCNRDVFNCISNGKQGDIQCYYRDDCNSGNNYVSTISATPFITSGEYPMDRDNITCTRATGCNQDNGYLNKNNNDYNVFSYEKGEVAKLQTIVCTQATGCNSTTRWYNENYLSNVFNYKETKTANDITCHHIPETNFCNNNNGYYSSSNTLPNKEGLSINIDTSRPIQHKDDDQIECYKLSYSCDTSDDWDTYQSGKAEETVGTIYVTAPDDTKCAKTCEKLGRYSSEANCNPNDGWDCSLVKSQDSGNGYKYTGSCWQRNGKKECPKGTITTDNQDPTIEYDVDNPTNSYSGDERCYYKKCSNKCYDSVTKKCGNGLDPIIFNIDLPNGKTIECPNCINNCGISLQSLSGLDGEYITYINEEGDFAGLDRALASSDGSKEEATNRTFDLYNSASSASITGLSGKEDGSAIYNAYASTNESSLYNANANTNLNIIQNEGANNNIITAIKSEGDAFNAFASGNASSIANINIEDKFSSDNIIYGINAKANAYNAYANGDTAFASGNININTNTNKEAYGIYAKGDIYNISDNNTKSTVNINNTGSGDIYGLYSESGNITNSGDINLSSTEGKAYGIYLRDGEGNVIENTGNINIETTNAGYGIYVQDAGSENNGVEIYNKGVITINANEDSRGIKIENNGYNAYVENTGTIKVNGDINGSKAIDLGGAVLMNRGIMSATSTLNLDSFNATHILDGGTYIAESISGSTLVSINNALNNNEDELVEKDSFIAEDVSEVDIKHQSTMYDTKLVKNENNNYDAVSTRKNFNEFTKNKSLANYLEENYKQGNLTDVYNTFKNTSEEGELTQKITKASGNDMLALIPQENIQTLRHIQEVLTDSILAPTDKIRRIVGGADSYRLERDETSLITGYDNNTTTTYMYGDKELNTKNRMGLGLAILRSSTSYDNGASKKENFINIFVPWIHKFKENLNLASIFNVGYGFGSLDRGIDKADIKDYAYGLSNRITYTVNISNIAQLEPQIFLNTIGYYQNEIKENAAQGLFIKQGNHLSVEGGFGLYLRKLLFQNDKHKLQMKVGGAYYHEFGKPLNKMRAGFVGGQGTYLVDDANLYDHDRALLEATVDYQYKALDMYLKYYHLIQKNKSQTFDFGVKYNF